MILKPREVVDALAPHQVSLSADHLASAAGGYEPQRKFDWFLYLNGVTGAETIRLSMESSFLPVEENEPIELSFGNEKVYVAGQTTYTEGTITVRDMVDKDLYTILRNWRRQVYDPTTGNIGLAATYKQTARIVLVAPDNSTLRQFQLTGLWPRKIDPGTLDYKANEIVLITMTLRFDKALPTS